MTHKTLSCTAKGKGERIDKLLSKIYPQHSRAYFQYLIDHGHVLINKSPCKKRSEPKGGDEILVTLAPLPDIKVVAENSPITILFEDKYFVAIDKPSQMVTHPAPGSPNNSVVGALLHYLGTLPTLDDPLRPGIIHRLDKETSGVIIVAKTATAHRAMSALFANREIEKTYMALCHSTPRDLTCIGYMGRHPKNRQQMTLLDEGKFSETNFAIINKNERHSLIKAMPKTGRTHQIRVHLKHLGAPILGDPIYGPSPAKAPRTMLHASALSFQHPLTSQNITIEAPLPADFISAFKHSLKKL